MAKAPKNETPGVGETYPDAWERFQQTMDKIVPPKRKKDEADSKTGEDEA